MKYYLKPVLLSLLLLINVLGFAIADKPEEKQKFTNTQLLTEMHVVDVSERELDGHPALAIRFSQSLDPLEVYDTSITVTQNNKIVKGSWVLSNRHDSSRLYFTAINPKTEYYIAIRKGIKAKNGLVLNEVSRHRIVTRDMNPVADFATKGSVLPARLTSGIPIKVVNTTEVDIEFLRVQPDKLKSLIKTIDFRYDVDTWELNRISSIADSVYTGRFTTGSKPNTRATSLIPVENIAELQKPGLYFAVMRRPGTFGDYKITHFVVTDIGLHVRKYSSRMEVFVSSLESAKPLADVTVKLIGKEESVNGVSDAKGQVSFSHLPKGPLLLTAFQNGQTTFIDMREPALDLSEFSVSGALAKPVLPFIFSNRDLFRPGETVDLSVLLRDLDGKSVANNTLHIRVKQPDNKAIYNEVLRSTSLGFFGWNFPLPSDAKTGSWTVEARINSIDKTPAASWKFHVEEFMPERMKLDLSSKQETLRPGQKLIVDVQGDYLYGAPASGNKFTATHTVKLEEHPLKQYKDFYFGDSTEVNKLTPVNLGDKKLDDKGYLKLEVPVPATKNSPLKMSLYGSLYETGGRSVNRSLQKVIWPGDEIVGIKPMFEDDLVDSDSSATFKIIRTNDKGELLSGKGLVVTLIREDKDYYWEYHEEQGWKRKDLSSEYPVISQTIDIEAGQKAEVSFAVKYGDYRVEVEDAATGLKSAYSFYAGWDWGANSDTARPDKVELTLDKKSYHEGETAKLKIVPPKAGDAIVTVEADKLLWSQRISLPNKGSTIDIPIDKNWSRHDLYITVTALRPADKQEKITPSRAIGIVHLPLDRSDRKLDLTIEAPGKIRPEREVSIKVHAEGVQSQSAIVVLSAVDIGVLNITDYKTPDPFKFFFDKREYAVAMHDIYGKIIENMDGTVAKQRFGGDSQGKKKSSPRGNAEVQIVSLYNGPVNFDASGNAEIKLNIPGFDGALRLMAIAFSEDKFGSTDKEMIIASPVVPALAGPRFLTRGDTTHLTLDLNNTTDTEQVVKLDINVNERVSLDLPAQSDVITLPPKKRKTLQFPLSSKGAFGVGKINLKLTGSDFVANRTLEFEIRPAWPGERFILQKALDKTGDRYQVPQEILLGLIPETTTTTLTVSNQPPLELKSVLKNLIKYPYGCLEQTTSRAYPYLYLDNNVIEALNLKPVTARERNTQVQTAIARLSGMQLSNGAFTLWGGGYGSEEYWLTPYVTNFLLDAKEQGFMVPEQLLERALTNLKKRLLQGDRYINSRYRFADSPRHLNFAARAYAAYVLSRVNRAPLGIMRVMYDKDRNNTLSGLPLVHLGLALEAQGDHRRADLAIAQGLKKTRTTKKYLGDYGSKLRDQAMILDLLLRHRADIPNKITLIRELADSIHNKRYFSTQEQVFIFLAGQRMLGEWKSDWKASLQTGDAPAVELLKTGIYSQELTAKDIRSGVHIRSINKHPLYISVEVSGYTEKMPTPNKNSPVSIYRAYYDMQGKRVKETKLQAGKMYIVHLLIKTNKAINDALAIDLLPAGVEIENLNLLKNNDWAGITLSGQSDTIENQLYNTHKRYQGYLDDRYVAALPLTAKKSHDLYYLVRAVTPGKFVMPPAYIEDMYRPEIHAIGVSPGIVNIQE
jgi:uncharacterized protein YfaS (alpha-2-macroglobulin family)